MIIHQGTPTQVQRDRHPKKPRQHQDDADYIESAYLGYKNATRGNLPVP
jgi:hypothetical protein